MRIFPRGMDTLVHVVNMGNVFLPESLLSLEARETLGKSQITATFVPLGDREVA